MCLSVFIDLMFIGGVWCGISFIIVELIFGGGLKVFGGILSIGMMW